MRRGSPENLLNFQVKPAVGQPTLDSRPASWRGRPQCNAAYWRTLMARANRVREIWADGKAVVNSWLGIPSSFSAEVMAHAGWDSLVVDMQHGMIDYSMMVPMLQGISTTGTVPLVRVPWNDPAHIQKALDAGAYGIVCPMINNRDEAERFVDSMRYAPLGHRSSGPIRASLYGGPDYHMQANDLVVAFGMIETAEAINKLDEILL